MLLSRRGALLSLADINATALAEVAAQAETERERAEHHTPTTTEQVAQVQPVFTSVVDVRSAEECNAWIAATVSHFRQPLSGAANLAGVFGPSIGRAPGAVRNLDNDEFAWVMDVNVKGTLNCMRAQLAHMQTREGARGRHHGGAIVNASSVAGISGGPLNGPYVASKHAIVGLTRTAAKEEGERGIRVNAVAPGIIATPMITQIEAAVGSKDLVAQGDPGVLGRKGEASEVAEGIVFLLGPQSRFITGVVLPIDGGWAC
ncbi:NAD(P)-binding protein [Sodiomyces alkalinus F11]|uniref:NAD(P)-binding protein n=1 Tax=Sodiomyces alkalinus (strain CBS 110278 / VKM F-3762 / F11) TaxID=1314773 RepID=A0A3N2Q2V7_SODAK|nr:NAD(P)-binding protein [Sodiomyces alkalinus F11]ROT41104.1 NAD(P)-binding protein [Sodiomyces alkalinus F11]